MKQKKIIVIVIVGVGLAITAGLIVWLTASKNNAPTPQVINGRVTHISNECWSDGTCSVTLDNSKSIVTGCGLMPGGKTCRPYDQSKLHSGQQIEATVMKGESGTYNLECDSCTIRAIE